MPAVARLGDPISHGGSISSASPHQTTDGIATARKTDTATCSLHGTVTIAQGSSSCLVDGLRRARVGDALSCGAVISGGSPHVTDGGTPT